MDATVSWEATVDWVTFPLFDVDVFVIDSATIKPYSHPHHTTLDPQFAIFPRTNITPMSLFPLQPRKQQEQKRDPLFSLSRLGIGSPHAATPPSSDFRQLCPPHIGHVTVGAIIDLISFSSHVTFWSIYEVKMTGSLDISLPPLRARISSR
jgi:hypothetical protein